MKNKINSGYKLWKESLRFIPGGNGLLSKRPERYASFQWPTYYESSRGIELTDLDGNRWFDFAQMGLGCAILGYNNTEVNNYVINSIRKGINTTLNCPEESLLAKQLLKFNKFATKVRFCRSGGEAMSIAVRIARSYSKSYKIAFSGYHGWHDWYLSTNLNGSKNLDNQLLPGLKPNGVPKQLKNTCFPFNFNNLNELKKIINTNKDLKIIVLEGARNGLISNEVSNYLNNLRLRNYIIIVDEITSGLRTSLSGAFKDAKLNPDIVVYGKALGNGFAINAIVGNNIMEECQETFISSSFHTERVGFAAALKTLEIIKREKLWKKLYKNGHHIIKNYKNLSRMYNIHLSVNNFFPLPSYSLNYRSDDAKIYQTYIIQEFLKFNILASTSLYLSLSHTSSKINFYLKNLEKIFTNLEKIISSKASKDNFLEIPVIDTGFKRLT